MARMKDAVEGNVGSHFGTLALPVVALAYNTAILGACGRGDISRDFLLFGAISTVLILLALAAISWPYLRENPTVGVLYSSVLFFMVPFIQQATHSDLLQLLFGATAALAGGVGILYFVVKGIILLKAD